MEIINIKGKSGYIKGGTNTGVYQFKDNTVLLIDAGHSVNRGIRMAKMLKEQNLLPTHMLTTHEHFDHFEAFAGLKEEFPDIKLIAHPLAKPYIENLYLGMAYMTSSAVPKFFGRKNNGVTGESLEVKRYTVDILADKDFELSGETFQLVHTPGHCSGQTVLITPDKVGYFGDAILDRDIIDTYDIPFLFDIKMHGESLGKMKTLDIDYGLVGHSRSICNRQETLDTIEKNLIVLKRYEDEIVSMLAEPRTREEILARLMTKYKTDYNYVTYQYNNSTVGAYLAKLSNENRIGFECADGKLYYFLK